MIDIVILMYFNDHKRVNEENVLSKWISKLWNCGLRAWRFSFFHVLKKKSFCDYLFPRRGNLGNSRDLTKLFGNEGHSHILFVTAQPTVCFSSLGKFWVPRTAGGLVRGTGPEKWRKMTTFLKVIKMIILTS